MLVDNRDLYHCDGRVALEYLCIFNEVTALRFLCVVDLSFFLDFDLEFLSCTLNSKTETLWLLNNRYDHVPLRLNR